MEELVQMAKEGNDEAFTKLILDLEMDMYKIAKIRLPNENSIDDAVQDTILEVYKSLKKLKKNEYFKTWVIRILINKCNKIYKKSKKEELLDNEQELEYIKSPTYDVENKIDFYILLEGLNYDERIALTLYYMEDLSNEEISTILKEPIGTIKSRIARARKKIEKKIGGNYNGII